MEQVIQNIAQTVERQIDAEIEKYVWKSVQTYNSIVMYAFEFE